MSKNTTNAAYQTLFTPLGIGFTDSDECTNGSRVERLLDQQRPCIIPEKKRTHPIRDRPPNPKHTGLGLERSLVCRQDDGSGIDHYLLRFRVGSWVEPKVRSMQNHPTH
jgi:hypothetical protein